MKLRHQRPSDSLDLLLDTMCNAFGGIILMAVLLALITNHQRNSSPQIVGDASEITQRRILLAESELARAMQSKTELLALMRDESLQERLSLIKELGKLKAAVNQLQNLGDSAQTNLTSLKFSDPGDRLKQLESEIASASLAKTEAENALRASETNTARLSQRLKDINEQIQQLQTASVEKLRLPRERATSKDVYNVIVQYGLVYPLRPSLKPGKTNVEWTFGEKSSTPRPIPGAGFHPVRDAAALKTLFGQLSTSGDYVAFYVFEDSFGAFNTTKKTVSQLGLDYGWKPLKLSESPLSFGRTGTSPQVQ